MTMLLLLFAAGIWAGAQNALAGGGSFITLPALILAGLDPRAANLTSTVALFPGQLATGWAGRAGVAGAAGVGFGTLAAISLVGGSLGALLLLATPSALFERLLPWLVLTATALFAWGAFGRAPGAVAVRPPRGAVLAAQGAIAVYGGYFGGGIGFLMLAAFTLAGLAVRAAGATKNVLAALMNVGAAAIFVFSGEVGWQQAAALGAGSVLGGLLGAWGLKRVPERALKLVVVVIGVGFTVALFLRG